jgi:hypothetical protein
MIPRDPWWEVVPAVDKVMHEANETLAFKDALAPLALLNSESQYPKTNN